MSNDYKSLSHCRYLVQYHLVLGGYIMKTLKTWEMIKELTEKPYKKFKHIEYPVIVYSFDDKIIVKSTDDKYKNLSLYTKDEWEEKIIVMKYMCIDEFIEILKNFHYIDCEFKECKECELYGEVCDVLAEFSNKYM